MKTLLESLSTVLSEMESLFGIPRHIRRLSSHARTLGKVARSMSDSNAGERYLARQRAEKAHKEAANAIVKHIKTSQGFITPREHEVLNKLRGHHVKSATKHGDARSEIMHNVSSSGSYSDRASFLSHIAPHAPHTARDLEPKIAARIHGARDLASPEAWATHAKELQRKSAEAARRQRDSAEAAQREKTDPAFKSKVDSEFNRQKAERERGHKTTADNIRAAAEREGAEEADAEKGAMGHKRRGRDTLINKAIGAEPKIKPREMTPTEREAAIQAAVDAKKKIKNEDIADNVGISEPLHILKYKNKQARYAAKRTVIRALSGQPDPRDIRDGIYASTHAIKRISLLSDALRRAGNHRSADFIDRQKKAHEKNIRVLDRRARVLPIIEPHKRFGRDALIKRAIGVPTGGGVKPQTLSPEESRRAQDAFLAAKANRKP